jgi:hypothetical protein
MRNLAVTILCSCGPMDSWIVRARWPSAEPYGCAERRSVSRRRPLQTQLISIQRRSEGLSEASPTPPGTSLTASHEPLDWPLHELARRADELETADRRPTNQRLLDRD